MYRPPELTLNPDEVLVYLRKSRSDDPLMSVEEVLAKHETMLDEWSEKNLGGLVPEENKYREVVSGETLKERPEINTVLRRIESPKIKAVAAVEPQRLTRGDLEDIGRLMKLFKHTKTLIITPTRTYDLQDDYDWDAFERELKRGNEFLEYTKKILNRGRLLSVSQGNYIGSIPPYGYKKVFVTDGKRKCPTLEVVEDQAEVVRTIFDLFVNQNYGSCKIRNYLNDMHVPAPRGEKWTENGMRDMLTNVHYIGKVKWNWRKNITTVEESEIVTHRPKAQPGEYLIFEGKHEAIISEALFSAAQEKIGHTGRVKSEHEMVNPFAGILFCKCGKALTMKVQKGADGNISSRFYCANLRNCGTSSCMCNEIVEKVSDTLKQAIQDFTVMLDSGDKESIKRHTARIKILETKLQDLEKREMALWETQADPDLSVRMPNHIFLALNDKIVKEREQTTLMLEQAYASMPNPKLYRENIQRFSDAVEALNSPEVPAAIKNKLLKACIARIEYSKPKSERIKSSSKRIWVNGHRIRTNPLPTGGNWTSPEISLDIKLRV